MQTFKQFLLEDESSPEMVAEAIFRDCQPFLKESKLDPKSGKTYLYRGMERSEFTEPLLSKIASRKNREPKDMDFMAHEELDEALKTLSGIKYRTMGTFAIGSYAVASQYGIPRVIFPIGEFDYCWSSLIGDAYTWFDDGVFKYGGGKSEGMLGGYLPVLDEDDNDSIEEYLNAMREFIVSGKAKYVFNEMLDEAISKFSDHEVMIRCDSYYMFNGESRLAGDAMDELSRLMKR